MGLCILQLEKEKLGKKNSFLNGSRFLPSQSLCSCTLVILMATQALCQVTVFCLLLSAGWLKMSSFQIFLCYPTLCCFHHRIETKEERILN